MASKLKATIRDAKDFADFGYLQAPMTLSEVKDQLDNDGILQIETSDFTDPGGDYTALYLNDVRIGYWPGY